MANLPNNRKVLITGAAGLVGHILRGHWGNRYRLRLADIRPIENAVDHEEPCETDITNYRQLLEACDDIDTVVHLAADPDPRGQFYESLLPLNIIGAYNAFQAAHEADCRRVVFTSSINAMLGHCKDGPATWDAPIYPQNIYGATKCWGEALARVYSDQHQLSCICVRLGSPRFDQNGDWEPDAPNDGISPRDTAQLFGRCIDVEDVDFAIVHGLSRHRHPLLDVEVSCQVLGYKPQDGTALPKGDQEPRV